MKVVTVAEIREIEGRAVDGGLSWQVLMERAGLRVAEEARDILGQGADWTSGQGKRVLVLVGPGNNGGDGLVAARHLHDWGASVHLHLLLPRPLDDPNFRRTREREIPFTVAEEDDGYAAFDEAISEANLAIDALLGTGASRPLRGTLRQIALRLGAAKKTRPELAVLAVDLPTGLNADTGAVDPACPPADVTVTLGYPKVGLLSFPGANFVGRLVVGDIGLPPANTVLRELITDAWARSALPQRPKDAHKGSFGRILVAAGSINYVGAAALAASGAIRVGAGLATIAAPRTLHSALSSRLLEATHIPLAEAEPGIVQGLAYVTIQQHLPQYDVILIGCGLGQHQEAQEFVRSVLLGIPALLEKGVVVDADAINTLAGIPRWWERLENEAILTPHSGEMARLLATDISDVQSHRLESATTAAARWNKVVILKGAITVIAAPDGRVMLSPWANPGLATAGSGDVLAGAIAGFLGQGIAPFAAAALGVYIHGLAGELVRRELGDAGMAAGDLLPALPKAIKQLKA